MIKRNPLSVGVSLVVMALVSAPAYSSITMQLAGDCNIGYPNVQVRNGNPPGGYEDQEDISDTGLVTFPNSVVSGTTKLLVDCTSQYKASLPSGARCPIVTTTNTGTVNWVTAQDNGTLPVSCQPPQ